MTQYKCHTCLLIVEEVPCPKCGEEKNIKKMCEDDHCHCTHEVESGVAYCPKCGAAMCPICKCHDVSQVSRVTGYLSDVGGWNEAKRQELKDRQRYSAGEKK
jgi:hypothetical protein